MKATSLVSVALLLMMVAIGCRGEPPEPTLLQFAHRSWGIKEGAPSSIWQIAQTKDGFLWLAGPFGLVRFDGVQFLRFQSRRGDPLPEKGVSALYAPPDGGLWIAYRAGGLAFIDGDKATLYTKPSELPESPVFALVRDMDGVLWAAHGSGLARQTADGWHNVDKDWNFNAPIATAIFLDKSGTLWVGTEDTVLRLPRGARKFEPTGEHDQSVEQITQDRDGAIWVSAFADASLHKIIDASNGTQHATNIPIGTPQALFDSQGALWLPSMGDGLFRTPIPSELGQRPAKAARDAMERFTLLNGLTGDSGWSAFEDREGNIWVGSANGLDRFNRGNIVPVPLPPGHQGFSLAAGDHGDVWISSLEKPAVHVEDNKVTVSSDIHGAGVAYRESNGTLWWAENDGVRRYSAGHFSFYPYPPTNQNTVVITIASREDGLWVSRDMGAPYRLQNGTWTRPDVELGLPVGKHATVSHTDSAGRLWLNYTKIGIVMLDHGKQTVFPPTGALDIGGTLSMGGDGTQVFVGGESGLAGFNGTEFHRLLLAGDESLNSVVGIAQGDDGSLWLSEANGIVNISKAEVDAALTDSGHKLQYRLFDYSDGLPSTPQLGRPINNMIRASDGRIWFATDSAPAWIDPHHLTKNTVAPEVSIERLTADRTPYLPGTDVKLPLGTNEISVSYTAASLTAPERAKFRYRLMDGQHSSWGPASARREAFFTNLSPGSYRFEVVAENEDGVASSKAAVTSFIVQPRFYQTRVFVVSCVVLGILILAALHRLRLHQLSARLRMRLSERVAERERIARELHDTFLQGIYGLVCQLEVVRIKSAGVEPTHSALTAALGNADRLLADGRDRLVQLRTDTTDSLPVAIEALCADQTLVRGQNVSFKAEGAVRRVTPSAHDEIYRICAEAVANACQHAKADSVAVELNYRRDLVQLSVRDNGVGIERDIIEAGQKGGRFGLRGMFERARNIGGRLDIRNLDGGGLQVTLTVNGVAAYLDAVGGGWSPRYWALWWRRAFRGIDAG